MNISSKIYVLLFSSLLYINNARSQNKPTISPSDYNNWLTLNAEETKLSYTGNYFAYQLTSKDQKTNTGTFESTNQEWKNSFENVRFMDITNLGEKEIGLALIQDSLWIITLGIEQKKLITNVQSVSMSQPNNKEELSVLKSKWILINKKDQTIELINSSNNKAISIGSVSEFQFMKNSETPIIRSKNYLLKVNYSLAIDTIYEFQTVSDRLIQAKYSNASNRFYIQVNEAKQNKIIELGTPNKVLISNQNITAGIQLELATNQFSLIDGDSTMIISLSPRNTLQSNSLDTQKNSLVLWTYLDSKVAFERNNQRTPPIKIQYAYNIFTSRLKALENDSMAIKGFPSGEWAILMRRTLKEDPDGNLLRKTNNELLQAASVKALNNIRTKIPVSAVQEISPLNKHIIYLSGNKLSVFTLNNQNDFPIFTLTETIQTQPQETEAFVKVAGWSENNDTVYFYYNYDLYMSSCLNEFPTRNLTSGYGLRNRVQFYIRSNKLGSIIQYEDLKFLMAIDHKNMDHGFYSISLNTNNYPTKLESGPFYYVDLRSLDPLGVKNLKSTIKARGSNRYLITRSSINESPNLFFTEDFKRLTQLTHINPEAKYNWMKSELIEFELPDRSKRKGILYRPENFDYNKKYPLIITSYLGASRLLNAYIEPADLCHNCLPNIPTYVSNGYMVFVPDILRPIGNTFMNAAETIKGALKMLSNLKQVDINHIGIAGCSFSGFTTDFALTQINNIRAAVVSSGIANPISIFNALTRYGFASTWYQKGQGNFGVSLYDNPQLYIRNSTILQADKITTPLLLMHTTNDITCPFYDALQFFVALRNLNKTVWLLEYQKGVHAVSGDDIPDFSQRMRQFFDHYLKETPAPGWMTQKTFDPWNPVKNNLDAHLIYQPPTSSK